MATFLDPEQDKLWRRKAKLGPTDAEKLAISQSLYKQAIPGLTKAMEADPRTITANRLLDQGTSFAPVSGVADGIARALAGGLGGYISRQQRDKYKAAEELGVADLITARREQAAAEEARFQQMLGAMRPQTAPAAPAAAPAAPAAAPASPAAAPAPQGMIQPSAPPDGSIPGIAQALQAGGPQVINPAAAAAQQQGPVGPAALAPNPISPPSGGPGTGQSGATFQTRRGQTTAAPSARVLRPGESARATDINAARPNSRVLFQQGIIPIEGGTDKYGRFRTSPAGAVGPAQVMPGTAPEAARLAGLPYDEYRYRTDAAYNTALGQAYYDKQLQTFGGDPIKAAAAYNAGPGNVQRAMRRAAASGGDWKSYLPDETKKYVRNFAARVGGAGTATVDTGDTGGGEIPQYEVGELPQPEAMPEMTPLPERVRSLRLDMADRLLGSGGDAVMDYMMAQPYLEAGYEDEQKARETEYGAKVNRGYLQDQMALSRYGQSVGDIRAAQIAERQARINANIAARAEAQQHGYRTDEQRAKDQADRDLEQMRQDGLKMPAKTQGQYRDNFVQITKLNDIAQLLKIVPDAVGLRNRLLPKEAKNRIDKDPNAIRVRAMIAAFASEKLHERSGASVTVEEFARQHGWLINDDDNAEIVASKIVNIINGLNAEQQAIASQYQNSPAVTNLGLPGGMRQQPQEVSPVTAAGVGGQLPPGVTVTVR